LGIHFETIKDVMYMAGTTADERLLFYADNYVATASLGSGRDAPKIQASLASAYQERLMEIV